MPHKKIYIYIAHYTISYTTSKYLERHTLTLIEYLKDTRKDTYKDTLEIALI